MSPDAKKTQKKSSDEAGQTATLLRPFFEMM